MIVEVALTLIGLLLILKGSEWVTDASVPVARFLNTTNVAVGLVLVSVLLSLPELIVAVSATVKGHSDFSVGAIVGSVIVNLGLIIGISALIHPLKIPRHVITRDAVFMLIATMVVALIVLEDLRVTQKDGIVFLLLFIPYLVNLYEQEKTLATKERRKESDMIAKTLQFVGKVGGAEIAIHDSRIIFVAGIAMLVFGADMFTNSMLSIAFTLKVPDLLVGITLGALGPSIANLAAAIQAVRRGYDELAVSETIGSNIFTLLITLGVVAIASPFAIDPATAAVTAPALLIVTLVFFAFTLRGTISRTAGAILVALYLLTVIAEVVVRLGLGF
ncbi:MAG: sodium:calcium antiporter [Candidatus Micrarchaeia archaeon]